MYSGQTASYSYKLIKENHAHIKRVFVLGPDHFIGFKGIGISDCDIVRTPIGNFKVNRDILNEIRQSCKVFDLTQKQDEREHSMEMQYPLLKFSVGEDIELVPVMIGDLEGTDDQKYATVFEKYFEDSESLFIFSTDFCHWGDFYDYKPMQKGRKIYEFIKDLDYQGIDLILKKDSE
jgi:AmmeMemoRadiSam system protein B